MNPSLSSCFFRISSSSCLFFSSSTFLAASSATRFFSSSSILSQFSASYTSLLASSSLFLASSSSFLFNFSATFPLPPTIVIFFLNLFLRLSCSQHCGKSPHLCPKSLCTQNVLRLPCNNQLLCLWNHFYESSFHRSESIPIPGQILLQSSPLKNCNSQRKKALQDIMPFFVQTGNSLLHQYIHV